eukprot:CAMPEP_0206120316 /NCGR_PEP_ID=MMETSP1472-20131121/437_1 /ASSEMBLY_ACC=CAM_ASM_001108 /TAXON_ID=41880 /ORGANISM="Pycnococcus provasolii, Strain RCC251" /LENGTH=190 /DNA_ID=CAMNT_0053510391 /DNA_START=41 /DNA_END=611 /DNA_ORIENTATION=+
MIKLFSVKEKAKKESAEAAVTGKKKSSAGELRIQKDISELNLAPGFSIEFPNGTDDLLHFEITLKPTEGYYTGGTFLFGFEISDNYPHDAPKVKCLTRNVFHPNIDLEGNICLNILREDWKPVLSINSVMYGLNFLFLDPNPEDPLNKDAAKMLRDNPRQFEQVDETAYAVAGDGVEHHTFMPPKTCVPL